MTPKINYIFKNVIRHDPRYDQTHAQLWYNFGIPGEDDLGCSGWRWFIQSFAQDRARIRFFLPRFQCVSIRFIRAQYTCLAVCEWQLWDCFRCLAWSIKSSSFRVYILNANVNKKAKTSGKTAFQRPIYIYVYIYICIDVNICIYRAGLTFLRAPRLVMTMGPYNL